MKDTLEYVQEAQKQRRFRLASVAMAVLTALVAVALLVCALCDSIFSGGFTWSRIVLIGCLLGLGVFAPFLCLKKRRLFWAMMAASVFTPLLLWTIHSVLPDGGLWYPAPSLAILIVALVWAWVPILLQTFTRLNKWYVGAAAAILGAPLNILINSLADGLPVPLIFPTDWILRSDAVQTVSNVSSVVLLLGLGILFIWLGRRKRNG